jgi:uncharacterized protein (TIGR02646 family)
MLAIKSMVEIEHHLEPHHRLAELASLSPVPPWNELRNPEKAEVKQQLNNEQHGLCVYCERHLKSDHGRIDHIACQKDNANLRFEYRNLCHSCSGYYRTDQGESKVLTCDPFKGHASLGSVEPRPGVNRRISLNPATGELRASESLSSPEKEEVDSVLSALGLNNSAKLKDDRKAALEDLTDSLEYDGDAPILLGPREEYYWTMKEFFFPET